MTLGTGNEREPSSGFTLIEVLVATVILFAGLAAVLGAYSSAVTAMDRAAEVLVATQLLQKKAAEVEWAVRVEPQKLNSSAGIYGTPPVRYDWGIDCQRLSLAAGGEVTEVVIDVNRQSRADHYTLTTQWAPFQPAKDAPL
jgi:prepilin-type N-terminal cleavage/methylation domain-containing protein